MMSVLNLLESSFSALLTSIGCLAALGSIYWAYIHSSSNDDLKYVPTPPNPSWLWGHDAAVYERDAGETYREWFDKYGPLLKLRGSFRHPYLLVAADLGVTKHILQTKIYDYHHSKIVRPRIERLLGKSLGWVEGAQEHRRMRRLVAAGLSLEYVREMKSTIYEAAGTVVSRLVDLASNANTISESKVDGGCIVNVLDWTGKVTLEITGKASFNHDFHCGESSDAQMILGAWRKMARIGISRKGFSAICILRRFPFLNHIPIKANRAHSVVKTTIQSGVARSMMARCQKDEVLESKDLLSLLMKAHSEEELSLEETMDHISMFIMAGHETTSQTLAFTLWELARNPDVQEKLRQEIVQFGVEPSYDDFQTRLPYLDAVCRESLRLHPALPYMERVATKDDMIPLASPLYKPGGEKITHLHIKAGQIIVTPIISIHQLASVWNDSTHWKPERWLDPSSLPNKADMPTGWGNLLAFSDGPRNCVGWRLGIFQYKAILFKLVESIEFIDTGADIASKVASSLQPCLRDRIEEGPQLPVRIRLVK